MGGALVEEIGEVPSPPDAETGGPSPTFQKWLFTNFATISVLSFLLVAIKVFRVSDMETSTALAVITSADTASVIRGVLMSLLPAFVAALIASFLYWRSESLIRAQAFPIPRWVAWTLLALALFIVATLAFILLAALFLATLWLVRRYVTPSEGNRPRSLWLQAVRWASFVFAVYFAVTFALERTSLWVPEERVRFAAADLARQAFPQLAYPRERTDSNTFIGYVLKQGDGATVLLTESKPGAVRVFVRIPANPVRRSVCLADPPSNAWYYRRPIQVLGQLARHVPGANVVLPQLEEGSAARTPYQPCFEETT